jgi:hypothetical protein
MYSIVNSDATEDRRFTGMTVSPIATSNDITIFRMRSSGRLQ